MSKPRRRRTPEAPSNVIDLAAVRDARALATARARLMGGICDMATAFGSLTQHSVGNEKVRVTALAMARHLVRSLKLADDLARSDRRAQRG